MITVIGYDGSPLSEQARGLVADADLVVGGERQVAAARSGAQTVVMGPVGPAVDAIAAAHALGKSVVVIASGDPGFFGITRRLRAAGLAVDVIPAVSSVATAFARLGLPWDEALVVSAHGRPTGPALNVLRRFGSGPTPVAVLTDAASSPAELIRALGDDCPDLHVLERLGEHDERITLVSSEGRADAMVRDWLEPNLVIAGGAGALDDHPWRTGPEPVQGWALADSAFVHRDGMLTKQDVRAAVLARLAPSVGELVWDVGAGSGSVGVECSRLGAAVVAIEQDPEALPLITTNSATHAAPVRVVHGKAPDALQGLPLPDAVFIGGGGPDVVAAVAGVGPKRVVIALATVERVGPTVAALGDYDVETVLLQVQHLTPLGDGHRLSPANPVFIVSGTRP